MDVTVHGNIGFLKTDKEFILVMNEKIFGPFPNTNVDKIISILKEVDKEK